MPKLDNGTRAPAFASSFLKILVSAGERPAPPYSLGQSGTVRPFSAQRSIQTFWASLWNTNLRPPQQVSSSLLIGVFISGGQFASIHARISVRNASSSLIGILLKKCRITMSLCALYASVNLRMLLSVTAFLRPLTAPF